MALRWCVVSDDIVTRLRERIPYAIHPHVLDQAVLLGDALREIEWLREAGDALAHGIRTGRWDDALDAWTELRGE